MNVLANLQEKLYQSDLNEKDYAYWQEQFFAEYFRYRDKNDSSVFGRMTMQGRKRIHFLLTLIHIVKNRFLGLRHTIISDGRTPTKRPVIYAVTHIGKFDIEVLCEIIKEHCYILSGDYENVQGTIVEFFFALNGVFYFNEQIKADRAQVKQKMIGHLQEGGNILFFPEGAWNLSPNLPVLPCYWGIIDIAKMGNAVIRPVAIEQYGKHFDISFGNDFDVQRFDDSLNQKTQAITELRDALATLKWEIWERHPEKRE